MHAIETKSGEGRGAHAGAESLLAVLFPAIPKKQESEEASALSCVIQPSPLAFFLISCTAVYIYTKQIVTELNLQ